MALLTNEMTRALETEPFVPFSVDVIDPTGGSHWFEVRNNHHAEMLAAGQGLKIKGYFLVLSSLGQMHFASPLMAEIIAWLESEPFEPFTIRALLGDQVEHQITVWNAVDVKTEIHFNRLQIVYPYPGLPSAMSLGGEQILSVERHHASR